MTFLVADMAVDISLMTVTSMAQESTAGGEIGGEHESSRMLVEEKKAR